MRQLRCKLSPLDAADGSASFEMGNTRVLAAVYGPRDVEMRSLERPDRATIRCEVATATFATGERRKRSKGDRRSAELALVLQATLERAILSELLPRTQLDVVITVVQADGGVAAAVLNAAVLALADAGVPMRDLLAACAASYLDSTPLLDSSYLEEAAAGPVVLVALHPTLGTVAALEQEGRLPLDAFEGVMALALGGCRAVGEFMRGALAEHTRRLAIARGPVRN